MKSGLFSFFLFRERHIDKYCLALALPFLLIESRIGGTIILALCAIGIWLAFARHASLRLMDRSILAPSLALGTFATGSFILSVLRDDTCVKWMPYFAELLLFPFLSVGLVLVRDPMRWLVTGAKIALCTFAIITPFLLVQGAERVGFGTNPVIAAYFFMLLSCVSRFDQRKPLKVNLIFFYLGMLPVLATGTRVGLLFYGVMIIIDIMFAGRHYTTITNKSRGATFAIAGCLISALMFTTALQLPVLKQRLADTVSEITDLDGTNGFTSMSVRLVMMRTATEVFISKPLMGAGVCQAVKELNEAVQDVDPSLKYRFFHNMVLDPLAFYGVIGIALFVWLSYAAAIAIWPKWNSAATVLEQRLAVACLLLMIFVYGLTGSFLSDDRMIAGTLLVFASLINQNKRELSRASRQTQL